MVRRRSDRWARKARRWFRAAGRSAGGGHLRRAIAIGWRRLPLAALVACLRVWARLPPHRLTDAPLTALAALGRRWVHAGAPGEGAAADLRAGGVRRAVTLGWAPAAEREALEPRAILAAVQRFTQVTLAAELFRGLPGNRRRVEALVECFEAAGLVELRDSPSSDADSTPTDLAGAGSSGADSSGADFLDVASWDAPFRESASSDGAGNESSEEDLPRLATAFLAVSQLAAELPPACTAPLLHASLVCARGDVDPYRPACHVLLARRAAADLVAEHPELDPMIHRLLERDPPEAVLGAVAAGLRRRRTGRTYGVADALTAWAPDLDQARLFSRAVDPLLVRPPERYSQRRRMRPGSHWRPAVRASVGELLAVVGAPVVALVGGILASRWLPMDAPATLTVGTSLTILGLLFGVDVYATEQTAIRLPGALARHVNRTRSLHAAYSAAVTMTLGVLIAGLFPLVEKAASWGTLGAIGYFAIASVLVLRSFVAGLEPGEAAATYVTLRRGAVLRAGRRFGRIQKQAVEIRRQAAALDHIRLVATPPVREGSPVLTSRRRGFLLPSPRALARLRRRHRWRDGSLTLYLSRDLGTIVRAHARLAVITSAAGRQVESGNRRRVQRLLRTRSAASLDRVSESGAVLLHLSNKLLDSGDRQGAERVAQALVRLVELHLAGVHGTQGPAPGQRPPEVPLLRTLLDNLVADSVASETGSALDFRLQLIDEVLAWTRPQDGASALLLAAVRREVGEPLEGLSVGDGRTAGRLGADGSLAVSSSEPPGIEDEAPPASDSPLRQRATRELLRMAAIHALELTDVDALLPILDELSAHAGRRATASVAHHLAASSEIVSLAMDLHPTAAPVLWHWFAHLAGFSVTGDDTGAASEPERPEDGESGGTADSTADSAASSLASSGVDDGAAARSERQSALAAAARIGGAALEAGMFSIALEVAVHLSRREADGPAGVRRALESDRFLRHESLRSERRGGYLGDHPADVLLRFARFVGRLAPVLT